MGPVTWMKRYTTWHREAQAELDAWLAERPGLAKTRVWSFGEDGTVVGKMMDRKGREKQFQRSYPKSIKVTSWFESKHFISLEQIDYSITPAEELTLQFVQNTSEKEA